MIIITVIVVVASQIINTTHVMIVTVSLVGSYPDPTITPKHQRPVPRPFTHQDVSGGDCAQLQVLDRSLLQLNVRIPQVVLILENLQQQPPTSHTRTGRLRI